MTKPTKLPRTASAKLTVLHGEPILRHGFDLARDLWNDAVRLTGSDGYPGRFVLQQTLRPRWRDLSARCYTFAILDYHTALKGKSTRPRPASDPRHLTFELGRNARHLGDWRFRLTVLGRHIAPRHIEIALQLRPGVQVAHSKLIRLHPDGRAAVIYYLAPQPTPGTLSAAIDLGIINLAAVALSNGETWLYSGRGLLSLDRRLHRRLNRRQKGHASAPRRARHIWQRWGRNRRRAVNQLTRHLIDQLVAAGVGTLAVGDLKGIRNAKPGSRAFNRKRHEWAFGELTTQLQHKGAAAGIDVRLVSEWGSSQRCARCGAKGNRPKRGRFHCLACGLVANADLNAARNLLQTVSPAPATAGSGVVAIQTHQTGLNGGAVLPGRSDDNVSSGEGWAALRYPTRVYRFNLATGQLIPVRS